MPLSHPHGTFYHTFLFKTQYAGEQMVIAKALQALGSVFRGRGSKRAMAAYLCKMLRSGNPESREESGRALHNLLMRHPEIPEFELEVLPDLIDIFLNIYDSDFIYSSIGTILRQNKGEPRVLSHIPALARIFGEEGNGIAVRQRAARLIYMIGEHNRGNGSLRAATPALVRGMDDKDERIRERACWALGSLGDASTLPVFMEALRRKPEFASLAIVAFGNIGDVAPIPLLIEALGTKPGGERRYAILEAIQGIALANSGMGKKELRDALPFLTSFFLRGTRDDCTLNQLGTIIGAIGEESSLPVLTKALGHDWKFVRKYAAAALGMMKDRSAVPALCKALGDESPVVRIEAAEALGKIRDRSAVPALVDALRDTARFNRLTKVGDFAADALGMIGDKEAVPALLEMLRKGKLRKQMIISSLGEIGDDSAVPHLLECMRDEEWDIRMFAAEALGKIRSAAAVPALAKTLDDEHTLVRRFSICALGSIGGPSALDALKAARGESDEVNRIYMRKAIASIGENEASAG